jgi:hypothetical protein
MMIPHYTALDMLGEQEKLMKCAQRKIEDFVFSGEQKLNSGKAQGLAIIIGFVFALFGFAMGYGSWAANFYLGTAIVVIMVAYTIIGTIIGIRMGADPSVNYYYSGFPQMYISATCFLLALQVAQQSPQTIMLTPAFVGSYFLAIALKLILTFRAIRMDKYANVK